MDGNTISFWQWLAYGGNYVVVLAGIVSALTVICGVIYKGWKKLQEPAERVAQQSAEADQEIHGRVDVIEANLRKIEEFSRADFASIKSIHRDQHRLSQCIAILTDGVFLVVQHLVTDDHIADMEAWMRQYATNAISAEETGQER